MRRMWGAAAVLCLVLGGVAACAGEGDTAAGQLTEQTQAAETTSAEPEPTPTTESPTPTPTPEVVTEQVTETQPIPYTKRTVYDSSLAKGIRRLRAPGVDGEKTLTYEVTTVDGVQTAKQLIRTEVTRRPVAETTVIGTKQPPKAKPKPKPKSSCDPNYSGCVPVASDVDCAGGSGNGPAYVRGPVDVIGEDIYDLDRDNDGVACEDD